MAWKLNAVKASLKFWPSVAVALVLFVGLAAVAGQFIVSEIFPNHHQPAPICECALPEAEVNQ